VVIVFQGRKNGSCLKFCPATKKKKEEENKHPPQLSPKTLNLALLSMKMYLKLYFARYKSANSPISMAVYENYITYPAESLKKDFLLIPPADFSFLELFFSFCEIPQYRILSPTLKCLHHSI
jgi:hypothetical protein